MLCGSRVAATTSVRQNAVRVATRQQFVVFGAHQQARGFQPFEGRDHHHRGQAELLGHLHQARMRLAATEGLGDDSPSR